MTVDKNHISIRICEGRDVKTLVRLGAQTFRETFESVNTPENMNLYLDGTFKEDRIFKELHEPGSRFFIAEENGRAVGFAKVRTSKKPAGLNGGPALEIERIYATKEMIGKGVGKKLMEVCLEHAVDHGYTIVWLGVWEHNLPAQKFYEKWGFRIFGSHLFLLGTDPQTDLLMKKELK